MDTVLCTLSAFIVGCLPGTAVLLYAVRRKRRQAAPTLRVSLADVPRLIECALDAQRKDRDMRLANTGYWGDTWLWVSRAIGYATPVLKVPADGDIRAWLASRPAALEAAHNEYRREEEDPDGYGSGTLWELRRALEELVENVGVAPGDSPCRT